MRRTNHWPCFSAAVTLVLIGMLGWPALAGAQSAAAFPGAQGGGAQTAGGRGGTAYLVTHTLDSGPGSLRACIEASGPRTCVFRTGGTISLLSSLEILSPFITIAGQTAPGGGIQITGPNSPGAHSLLIKTHDVIVQYLRIRRGHNASETCPSTCATNVAVRSDLSGEDPYNIVLDHITSEWSNYEALAVVGGKAATLYPRSITVSSSILGEALAGAGQVTLVAASGFSGEGSTAPDNMTDIDFHHNLFAGASHRFPLMTVKSGRLVNNIVYAWTFYPMRNKGFRDFVNNYFKLRSNQPTPSHEIQAWTTLDGNDTSFAPSFYATGNVGPSDPSGTSNWGMAALTDTQSGLEIGTLPPVYQSSVPISTPPGYIPITPDALSAISSPSGPVLNTGRAFPYEGAGASRRVGCTGAWLDARDSVDTRIVNAVANGTTLFGSYTYQTPQSSPQTQFDLGGWPIPAAGTACADSNNNGLPDLWESYWGGPLGLDPNGFNFVDGYTNLEHYIHGMNPVP